MSSAKFYAEVALIPIDIVWKMTFQAQFTVKVFYQS